MIGSLDDCLGGTQRMTEDKIREIRVIERHCAQEQCFFLGPDPQGHSTIVFDRYSRHACVALSMCTH